MLRTKKKIVTAIIHARLTRINIIGFNPRIGSRCPETSPLVIFTTCVSGKTAIAVPCAPIGRDVNGKNVPHKKNIGVKNRNEGKLKKSMLGATEVKHMAMDANISPPKNANGITSRNNGVETNPNAATTAKTMVVLIVALVAPQRISPATTSSTLTGVATIASKVFWKYIRTKEANVHSKNEPFIIEIATSAGAMKLMYDWPLMLGMKPPKPKPNARRYSMGSRSEGMKLTAMVFVKTSKFRLQTVQTL